MGCRVKRVKLEILVYKDLEDSLELPHLERRVTQGHGVCKELQESLVNVDHLDHQGCLWRQAQYTHDGVVRAVL